MQRLQEIEKEKKRIRIDVEAVQEKIEEDLDVDKNSQQVKSKSEQTTNEEKPNHKTNSDPGWKDFSATCIDTASWQKASIWSDDEVG